LNCCVEIAFSSDHVAMRNSNDPDGAMLVFSDAEWEAFVRAVSDRDFVVIPLK
jgi:hypothetical protein